MNKIRFKANRETNYVFHMLSVARCGYDNAYGAGYRSLYPERELELLYQNRHLITVKGGEHCGLLHGLLVNRPARGECPAGDYYRELVELGNEILAGNIAPDIDRDYLPHTGFIMEAAEIMIRHYDHYVCHIWPQEEEKIKRHIAPVQTLFEASRFTEKAEALIGSLGSPFFTATLVSSVAGGAEGIDISREQDVFGIERTPEDALYFIGHEFIIYLLFDALKGEDAFQRFETWEMTEGLAEYYLKKIMGDTRLFTGQQKLVKEYEKLAGDEEPSAWELYRRMLGR